LGFLVGNGESGALLDDADKLGSGATGGLVGAVDAGCWGCAVGREFAGLRVGTIGVSRRAALGRLLPARGGRFCNGVATVVGFVVLGGGVEVRGGDGAMVVGAGSTANGFWVLDANGEDGSRVDDDEVEEPLDALSCEIHEPPSCCCRCCWSSSSSSTSEPSESSDS
jgi:hypothetical protein